MTPVDTGKLRMCKEARLATEGNPVVINMKQEISNLQTLATIQDKIGQSLEQDKKELSRTMAALQSALIEERAKRVMPYATYEDLEEEEWELMKTIAREELAREWPELNWKDSSQ